MRHFVAGCLLALLVGCGEAGSETVVSPLCPDQRLIGEWSEWDVSGRDPLLHEGALKPVVGHLLAFSADRMTETWVLDDGATLSGSIGYSACDGEFLPKPDPAPLAGGPPVVTYAVDGGRLQLGSEYYSRAGR
jgi:hypothetical protein